MNSESPWHSGLRVLIECCKFCTAEEALLLRSVGMLEWWKLRPFGSPLAEVRAGDQTSRTVRQLAAFWCAYAACAIGSAKASPLR